MDNRRVVITGVGAVTALGLDTKSTWRGVTNGENGVRAIDHFDASAFATRFSASLNGFTTDGYLASRDAKRMDSFIQYGMVAGIQAMRDSGLEITEQNQDRVGCNVGAGIGGIGLIEKMSLTLDQSGPRKISPFFVPGSIINMVAGNLSIEFNLRGPNLAMVTACTTGTHSIGLGARLIAAGDADAMLVGGAEMGTTPVGLGGFAAARALSTRNEEPHKASRPWDKDRDGFVLGDGAGVMLIESLDSAMARGANIYAEVVGFGMSGDAYHMTSPPEDGRGAALSMRNALLNAGMNPHEVDYINAHGTSTLAGDLAETLAIKSVYGDHAKELAVSSTKSMIGHLLGAAGAVEAIFSVLAIRDRVAPPTINLENPQEGCDLNYVAGVAQERDINVTMSNSFGFGGTNGTLVFKRFTE
ncbi:beta-ketoacyl-ACP synthase II [Luminiphilus sp.]|jgi:3-oxoacyl-[acyl-carrier-protein] synthase II|nr:beta-ketoacyl-ACP synthase II [Luminiphilus sp.]MBT5067113.1 beta-ketoacyl-ACP synthase II [Halieaceae bacterium]MBT5134317.1 beta-ketoacyl-ACP synthase II [Halieaceae bacterium]MBT5556593.1 beta-ketoacyl-ACP synthase II [Halieaceae bacterium]MBT6181174.1 beta-ketoacyl-ACP synthase II [Halieaceae bacterium]